MDLLVWLRSGLDLPGKTQRGLAKRLGIDESTVSKILSGKRRIKMEEIDEIAQYLGIPPPTQVSIATRPLSTIPVLPVHLAFGVWRERSGVDMETIDQAVPALADPRWAGLSQYAAFLNGTKSYAICVRFKEIRQNPLNGDKLHVRRTRNGMTEDTIRKAVVTRGKTVLRHEAEGGVPRHDIDYPGTKASEKVEIEGLVIGVFTAFL